MGEHLRYAGADPLVQQQAVRDIVRSNHELMGVLVVLRDERLPQALVGGYFDDADLSYEAEDRIIKRFAGLLAATPVPVEIRNQARLHMWFGQKFGYEVPPLGSSAEALTRYASRTHAVAVSLDTEDSLQIEAPFGLDDLFGFRIVPNTAARAACTYREE